MYFNWGKTRSAIKNALKQLQICDLNLIVVYVLQFLPVHILVIQIPIPTVSQECISIAAENP